MSLLLALSGPDVHHFWRRLYGAECQELGLRFSVVSAWLLLLEVQLRGGSLARYGRSRGCCC